MNDQTYDASDSDINTLKQSIQDSLNNNILNFILPTVIGTSGTNTNLDIKYNLPKTDISTGYMCFGNQYGKFAVQFGMTSSSNDQDVLSFPISFTRIYTAIAYANDNGRNLYRISTGGFSTTQIGITFVKGPNEPTNVSISKHYVAFGTI